jgi:hypothetical protein
VYVIVDDMVNIDFDNLDKVKSTPRPRPRPMSQSMPVPSFAEHCGDSAVTTVATVSKKHPE